ncbi:MAG: glutaredoxin family protein [Chthoniobacterales bacterium]|nr:glutaredoxin family protein [Chthoniobacterales bacterium]
MVCVNKPTLYVKTGCPYCKVAMDYLDEHQVAYETVDVRGDDALIQKLQEVSGQTRTPTMVWDGAVLPNFGVDELEKFLGEHKAA